MLRRGGAIKTTKQIEARGNRPWRNARCRQRGQRPGNTHRGRSQAAGERDRETLTGDTLAEAAQRSSQAHGRPALPDKGPEHTEGPREQGRAADGRPTA